MQIKKEDRAESTMIGIIVIQVKWGILFRLKK